MINAGMFKQLKIKAEILDSIKGCEEGKFLGIVENDDESMRFIDMISSMHAAGPITEEEFHAVQIECFGRVLKEWKSV